MQIPCIHLNGTSRESLLNDLEAASTALDAAYEAMKRTAPNGRDYYPLGPQAIDTAVSEHMSRLRRLDAIKHEIDDITRGIADA